MIRWLSERIQWTPVQCAFESTSPWRCMLQLRAERAAAADSTEHVLLCKTLCRAVANCRREGRLAHVHASPGIGIACRASAGGASWRSPTPSAGLAAEPPIPAAWARRLAPLPAAAWDEEIAIENGAADEYERDDGGDSEDGLGLLPPSVVPPGVLQLEVFLRHVESLSAPRQPDPEGSEGAGPAAAPAAPVPTGDESVGASTAWPDEMEGSESLSLEGAATTREPEHAASSLVDLALGLLQERMRSVVSSDPGDTATIGDFDTMRCIAQALRVVEWTANLMHHLGPRHTPRGCIKLVQKALRKVASWMRRTLPADPSVGVPLGADGAAAKVWSRSIRLLCALRSCLVSFAALAGSTEHDEWTAMASSSGGWPETLYVGMAAEPVTLVHGIRVLCAFIAQKKRLRQQGGGAQPSDPSRPDRAAAGARDTAAEVEVEMDLEFETEAQEKAASTAAMAGATSASAMPVAHHAEGEALLEERSGEGEAATALHRIIECLELWSHVDEVAATNLLTTLRPALDDLPCVRLRTRMRSLCCLATCVRAAPEVRNARTAPRHAANVSVTEADFESLHAAIEPWAQPARALLHGAALRLEKAASRVRKVKLDGQNGSDEAAAAEAAVAAAAANFDFALRHALTTASRFAALVPDVLPLGGSVLELADYNALWRAVLGSGDDSKGAVSERGGHTLSVRDRNRMVPLTPAARVGLVEALHEHIKMHARLHASLMTLRDPARPQDEVKFVDGSALQDAVEGYEEQLFEGLQDSHWAVRACVISALTTLVRTSVDEDHPDLLSESITTILGGHLEVAGERLVGSVPRFVFKTLRRGGGADGFGGGVSSADANPVAPSPYVSPAFEVRISALHALAALGSSSPVCLDVVLLLMLVAHGPDASRLEATGKATGPAATAGNGDEPKNRASLHIVAQTAVQSVGLAHRCSNEALLKRRAQQLLAMWLQLQLSLSRLPCELFGAQARGADVALLAFVSENRIPLATAAAMASNSEVLSTAAHVLGLPGGAADLLMEALPHVMARLLCMQGSLDEAEREAYTRGVDFVSHQLAPQPLHACVAPQLPELITSLLLCATTVEPSNPPKRSISHILAVLGADVHGRGSASVVPTSVPLAESLRSLTPSRLTALLLDVRAAVASGEAELGAFELLLDESLLSNAQLAAGSTPCVLQAALLFATRGGTEALSVDQHKEYACRLLTKLHRRLSSSPSVAAQLVKPLLRGILPLAPRSQGAQLLLKALFDDSAVSDGTSGLLPSGSVHAQHALSALAPYELCISPDLPGLSALYDRLVQAHSLSDQRSVGDALLACEVAAPAHLLTQFPVVYTSSEGITQDGPIWQDHPSLGTADELDAGSDLEVRAAVLKAIAILVNPQSFQCESLRKWFEDGAEEEEEEEASSGSPPPVELVTHAADEGLSPASIDEDQAVESGGEAWCIWNRPAHICARTAERLDPLERTRRWLLRLAAAPHLSSPLAKLIGQALGLCGLPRLLPRCVHRHALSAPTSDAESGSARPSELHNQSARASLDLHVRVLRQLHMILISTEAPPHVCRLAAQSLGQIMTAPPTREVAMRALNALRLRTDCAVKDVYYHLEPFSHEREATLSMACGAAGALAPRAMSPVDESAWKADMPRAQWLSSVVAPLLQFASDPLLNAVAPVAAVAPRFAAGLMVVALAELAAQDAHGAALAAAIRSVTVLSKGATFKPRAILRPLATIISAHFCSEVNVAPAAAGLVWSSPFWSSLDLLGLAEAASAHGMHATAIYFLEGERARTAALHHADTPKDSTANHRLALIRHLYVRASSSDMADGVSSLVTATPALRPELGSWQSHETTLSICDVGVRVQSTLPGVELGMAAGDDKLGNALDALQTLGCYALVQSLSASTLRQPAISAASRSVSTAPGGDVAATDDNWSKVASEALSERHHEMAWRLGSWDATDALGLPRHDGCHNAIALGVRQLGVGESEHAEFRRHIGRAQRYLAMSAGALSPEANVELSTLLSRLQLCGTLREASGTLAGDLLRAGSDQWLLHPSTVRNARRAGAQMSAEAIGQDSMDDNGEDRFDLSSWLEWRSNRFQQQMQALVQCDFRYAEPLVALHCAMLRELKPHSHADQLEMRGEAVKRARNHGNLDAARALLRQVAELCHVVTASTDGGSSSLAAGPTSTAGGDGVCSKTWYCRWQEAKLLWASGGEQRADALLVAKRLRDELASACPATSMTNTAGSLGGSSSLGGGHGPRVSLTRDQMALHARLLSTMGGWAETLRCEGRGHIESELHSRAVSLAESVGDSAVSEALHGLAVFHERQYLALVDEDNSIASERFKSMRTRTQAELRRTQSQLAVLNASQGDNSRRIEKLEKHERELSIALERDALEASFEQERTTHLEGALQNYLICLQRSTDGSATSRSAACAVCRLWMGNREQLADLSRQVQQEVQSGLNTKAFVPLAFQLTARLNSCANAVSAALDPLACLESLSQGMGPDGTQPAEDLQPAIDGSAEASLAFQEALAQLIISVIQHDTEHVFIHQLLAAAQEPSTDRGSCSAIEVGRRQAAQSLLQRLRADHSAEIDAITALSASLHQLALCRDPAGSVGSTAAAAASDGSGSRGSAGKHCVQIADALLGAGAQAEDVSLLHERIALDAISVQTVSSSVHDGSTIARYLPMYVPLQSGRSGCKETSSRLIWCVDEQGVYHPQILKARPFGALDVRRDALMQQVVELFNLRLVADPDARRRGLRVRGRRALPLAPTVGLYEFRAQTIGLGEFLAAEHAEAHESGQDALSLAACCDLMREAHSLDACQQQVGLRTPVSGSVATAAITATPGPSVRSAWARVTAGTTPVLHRFLLKCSLSPGAWLARRLALTRSLATGAIAGWLMGLGEREPHRLLLDRVTAEAIPIGSQALLLQRYVGSTVELAEAAYQQCRPAPPFRLTRELVDALGPAGVDGPFRCAAEVALRVAQSEATSAELRTLLEAFLDEPMMGWTAASDSAHLPWAAETPESSDLAVRCDAEVAVMKAAQRLAGGERVATRASMPLNVESRVRQLIAQATNEDTLAMQQPCWQAWL